jgi:hypothetical protein
MLEQMDREAAQGAGIFQADPAVRRLSWLSDNRALGTAAQAQGLAPPKERPGMHPTAVAVQGGEHTALLYYSNRRQAGENLQGLLDKRQAGLEKPFALSDALASNAVAKEAAVIRCHWLAHGRRPCSALAAVFPQECQGVLEVIRQVVDHDEQGRQEPLSAEARWASPQGPSQPLLAERQRGLDPQRDDHLGEPNRSLGRAIG